MRSAGRWGAKDSSMQSPNANSRYAQVVVNKWIMSEAAAGSVCKPPGVTPIGACRRCAVGTSVPIEL